MAGSVSAENTETEGAKSAESALESTLSLSRKHRRHQVKDMYQNNIAF